MYVSEIMDQYRELSIDKLNALWEVNNRVYCFLELNPHTSIDGYINWRNKLNLISFPRAIKRKGLEKIKLNAFVACERINIILEEKYDSATTEETKPVSF